ncbi:TonB-dependent receptor family protein [Chitinophaga nivalis]|uniref:TonB-dependent siderophore receptor n=1 Tax=Chitinophaga nivalis TaxID=2991709 RepID=A0ABT3IQ29_9BACT|nr:TonB-dependent siderophore receptor [Chitinophaga nivalis]MCW3464228.1 TonB-dependent siderophore receptor [Chitinophaga nivalis]MCW3486082.1 TonB-dependent siderophore receptor [Chitinophaga nivalis]
MKRFNIACLFLIFSLLIKGYAQSVPPDKRKIDQDSLWNISLQDVTVTSNGLNNKIKNLASTVNIVNSKQIKELGIQSVGDAIRLIPGANYQDEDGRGLKPGIGLRGLDPGRNGYVVVLVDGKIPLGQSYGQLGAYYMLPVASLERIEVIKGASPVLYGAGSIGGVINLITKKGQGKPNAAASIEAGSYNYLNANASAYGDNGKLNYYVNYNRRQGNGFRSDRSAFHTNDVTFRIGAKLDSTDELSVSGNIYTEDAETPGGLSEQQYRDDYRQSVNPFDQFYAQRYATAITYKKNINTTNSISLSVFANYFKRNWWYDTKRDRKSILGDLRDIFTGGAVLEYNRTNKLLGFDNSLIVGLKYLGDQTNSTKVMGADPLRHVGKTTFSTTIPTNVMEGYIQNEIHFSDQFSFTPGLRYTAINYGQQDYMAGQELATQSNVLVYSFGLLYKPVERFRTYATVSKGYNPPVLYAALDPGTVKNGNSLDAETSNNYEIGIRTNPVNWLDLSMSGYILDFNHKLTEEGGVFSNTGKAMHKGIEFELNILPFKGMRLYAIGALQRATFGEGTNKGNLLPYAPQQILTAGAKYQALVGTGELIVNAYHTFTGKQYNDGLNTEQPTADGSNGAIPAYNLLNLSLNYNWNNWGVSLTVNNLLNEKYFTHRYDFWGGIFPGAPTTVNAGLSYRIHH